MIELVTLAEIKDHLHIDHDADDGPLKEKFRKPVLCYWLLYREAVTRLLMRQES